MRTQVALSLRPGKLCAQVRVPAGKLFALYQSFTHDLKTSVTRFGIQLHDWKHVVRRLRTRAGMEYHINVHSLRELLIYYNAFDADAAFNPQAHDTQ